MNDLLRFMSIARFVSPHMNNRSEQGQAGKHKGRGCCSPPFALYCGSSTRARTWNTLINSQVLYH
jgi:hypothetical protein